MKRGLFGEVILRQDIPKKGLKQGDVATVVERHETPGAEDGYSLEVFNAVGDTIAVITVPGSLIKPLTKDKVFGVRPLATG